MLHQDIKSPDLLRLKNQAKLHLCWKQSIRRIRYPRVFQCNNGAEFKRDLTKLLEKHNVDIRRATTKYKHTHTTFVEAFNKELAKLLFKTMDVKELQAQEKVSTIWVINLNKILNKINNTKLSMIGMKPKNVN